MIEFKCNKCGLCCKQIAKVNELKYLDRGDGVCCHLKNNLCQIYDIRPLECRVTEMYQQKFSLICDVESFYDLNYKMCKKLQREQILL